MARECYIANQAVSNCTVICYFISVVARLNNSDIIWVFGLHLFWLLNASWDFGCTDILFNLFDLYILLSFSTERLLTSTLLPLFSNLLTWYRADKRLNTKVLPDTNETRSIPAKCRTSLTPPINPHQSRNVRTDRW